MADDKGDEKTEDSRENVMGVTMWAVGIIAVVLVVAWATGLF